jgi:hypothetical protein
MNALSSCLSVLTSLFGFLIFIVCVDWLELKANRGMKNARYKTLFELCLGVDFEPSFFSFGVLTDYTREAVKSVEARVS